MAERLRDAASPYLRAHADNPVHWWQWGPEPFAEAARRDVPVLVSIGYATCHWCHVMARESFSDEATAAQLNDGFVAIKVDREEHAEVDAAMLAAAAAFTQNLGWPLNVFVTPAGRAFFAGTYWPPRAAGGMPSFRQVLDAVSDAWADRRGEVERIGDELADALAKPRAAATRALPTDFGAAVARLASDEDPRFGGFGTAPKFPVAPVLRLLLERGLEGDVTALGLAERTLDAMAASALRDRDGGFFRYATQRDWTEPHYERMLYDNAQLLECHALAGRREIAEGVADFLLTTLRLPSGAFASGQDSESTVAGQRSEGGYYKLADRTSETPPALDEKVLTGWNGLAIRAFAVAGRVLERPEWVAAATGAADLLLERHVLPDRLVRASIGDTVSHATATLEDYGLLADGLLHLASATGEVRYALAARELVDGVLQPVAEISPVIELVELTERGHAGSLRQAQGVDGAQGSAEAAPFTAPSDPVLAAQGLVIEPDPGDGALPSGPSAVASAALHLHQLTGDRRYRDAAVRALEPVAAIALQQPIALGSALTVMSRLASPARQLVVVSDDPDHPLAQHARTVPCGLVAVVTSAQARAFADAGFELFAGRDTAVPTAFLCEDFVCRLPVTDADALASVLAG